ncbi:MAG: hypothetical protein ACRCXT_23855, partial [Paraclostridium sp.]
MYQVENINGVWHVVEKHEKGFYNFKRPCESENQAIQLCNKANGYNENFNKVEIKEITKFDLYLETLKPIQRTRTKNALENSTTQGLVHEHIEKLALKIKEIQNIDKKYEVRYIGVDNDIYISKCFYKSGVD